jgi:ABC-type transporter MlaC component
MKKVLLSLTLVLTIFTANSCNHDETLSANVVETSENTVYSKLSSEDSFSSDENVLQYFRNEKEFAENVDNIEEIN